MASLIWTPVMYKLGTYTEVSEQWSLDTLVESLEVAEIIKNSRGNEQ